MVICLLYAWRVAQLLSPDMTFTCIFEVSRDVGLILIQIVDFELKYEDQNLSFLLLAVSVERLCFTLRDERSYRRDGPTTGAKPVDGERTADK